MDRSNKIGFSLIPKCGSTSLRAIQFIKSGFFDEKTDFSRVSATQMWPVRLDRHHVEKIDPSQSADPAFDYLFITAIRHPITRLVSAYKDKIGIDKTGSHTGSHTGNDKLESSLR